MFYPCGGVKFESWVLTMFIIQDLLETGGWPGVQRPPGPCRRACWSQRELVPTRRELFQLWSQERNLPAGVPLVSSKQGVIMPRLPLACKAGLTFVSSSLASLSNLTHPRALLFPLIPSLFVIFAAIFLLFPLVPIAPSLHSFEKQVWPLQITAANVNILVCVFSTNQLGYQWVKSLASPSCSVSVAVSLP